MITLVKKTCFAVWSFSVEQKEFSRCSTWATEENFVLVCIFSWMAPKIWTTVNRYEFMMFIIFSLMFSVKFKKCLKNKVQFFQHFSPNLKLVGHSLSHLVAMFGLWSDIIVFPHLKGCHVNNETDLCGMYVCIHLHNSQQMRGDGLVDSTPGFLWNGRSGFTIFQYH